MNLPASLRALPTMAVISSLVLAASSLTALAQSAGPTAPPAPAAPSAESPKAAISRPPPTAPIPANAPRFASSGLEIKIASFGVNKKERGTYTYVTISLILVNNNDYDVAVLNVGGFSVIDNAGNSMAQVSSMSSNVEGVATCFVNDWTWCVEKEGSSFVPYDMYTVVSAKTAIPITYYIQDSVNGELGDLFTFSTKLMMYKVGTENEIARTKRAEAPRLITIGIPNILRR